MRIFVIMPFASEFDDLWKSLKTINEASNGDKLKWIRLDDLDRSAGRITPRLGEELEKADMCVADLTTLHTWEMLKPDIWLAHHTEYFGMEAKRKRAANEGVSAWVDPEGYRQFVAAKRRAFEDEVDAEMKVPNRAERRIRARRVGQKEMHDRKSSIRRCFNQGCRITSACT